MHTPGRQAKRPAKGGPYNRKSGGLIAGDWKQPQRGQRRGRKRHRIAGIDEAHGDPRPDARLVFDADQNKALLAEIPTLVGPIAMQDALGATKMELIALQEEGLLAPRTRIPSVKNVWRISDGHGLLTKLLARAVTITADDTDWETLLLARKRTGIGLAKMIDAIDACSLDVGTRQGVAGFHGIVVRLEQLAPLIDAKAAPDPTEGGKLQSAATFGRSVGLRDNGTFASLIEAGHVPAKARVHPGTKRMQYWMDEADITAFTAALPRQRC